MINRIDFTNKNISNTLNCKFNKAQVRFGEKHNDVETPPTKELKSKILSSHINVGIVSGLLGIALYKTITADSAKVFGFGVVACIIASLIQGHFINKTNKYIDTLNITNKSK